MTYAEARTGRAEAKESSGELNPGRTETALKRLFLQNHLPENELIQAMDVLHDGETFWGRDPD